MVMPRRAQCITRAPLLQLHLRRDVVASSRALDDRQGRRLADPEAELLIQPDGSGVGGEDVEEDALGSELDGRDQGAHQPGRKPLAAMVGVGADGADLRPAFQAEPLAGHRDEGPVVADPR